MKIIKLLKNVVICFIVLIASYSILQVLTFMIPQSWIEVHRSTSFQFLSSEGLYDASPIYGDTQLDNFTDGLVIMQGQLAPFSDNPLHHAFSIYARYWNGWVPFVRPLLIFGSISTIRVLYADIFVLLLGAVVLLLAKRLGACYAIIFLVALLPARMDLVAISLAYARVFWIAFILVIWLLWRRRNMNSVLVSFFVAGSVVNYTDILSAPLVTLLIPLVVFTILEFVDSQKICWTESIVASAMWAIGYGLTWISKWFLSSLITGKNIFADASNQAAIRTSGETHINGQTIEPTYHNALSSVISQFVNKADVLLLIVVLAFLIVAGFYRANKLQSVSLLPTKQIVSGIILLLVEALLPLLWIAVLRNHTLQHAFFTYRMLLGSYLAVLSGIWVLFYYSRKQISILKVSDND